MHTYDKIFWIMFVLLEAAIITGNVWNYTPLGVVMGFLVLAIGFARFGDHITHKEREEAMKKHNHSIERMKSWLENQYHLTQGIKELHDYRLHNMERRKIDLDEKMEKGYRELARKIMDLENRLNLVSKILISQHKKEGVAEDVRKAAAKSVDAFEEAWKTLTETARRDGVVVTLSRKVRNRVLEAGEHAIRLQSELTKKERAILKDELRQFWDILEKNGRLDFIKDVKDPKLLRLGSVAVSLLARLPNVEHDIKPRVLYLADRNTHPAGTLRKRGKSF